MIWLTKHGLEIIDIAIQLSLLFIAWKALWVWRSEIRGRDKYNQVKSLLVYIQDINFIVTAPSSIHQICINDILVNRSEFYNIQLNLITDNKIYLDRSVFGLFNHINTRADVFLPTRLRELLDVVRPGFLRKSQQHKNNCTYISFQGVDLSNVKEIESDQLFEWKENLNIKTYFERWEQLVTELQKAL